MLGLPEQPQINVSNAVSAALCSKDCYAPAGQISWSDNLD